MTIEVLGLATVTVDSAQPTHSSTGASRKRPLRPRDLHRLQSIGDVVIHPDESTAVYTVTWPDEETDSNRSTLHAIALTGAPAQRADGVVADRADGEASVGGRQLSDGGGDGADSAPLFSPDGSRLAFVRRRRGQPAQVMAIEWPSGRSTVLAEFDNGVSGLRWATDDRLVVSGPTRPDDQHGVDDDELARRPMVLTRLAYRFDGRGYVHDRPVGLFTVSGVAAACDPAEEPTRAEVTQFGMRGVDHGAFAVSPDGSAVVTAAATDDDADLTGADHLWLYQLHPGAGSDDGSPADEPEPIRLTEPGGSWGALYWHPDGTLVACGTTRLDRAGFSHPYRVTLPPDTPAVTPLSADRSGHHDRNLAALFVSGSALAPVGGPAASDVASGLLAIGTDRGRMVIDRHNLEDGSVTPIHHRDEQVRALAATADGSVVVAAITTTTRPAELWLVGENPRRLVALNDAVLDRIDLATTEATTVVSADGTEVEAFIIRPPESAPPAGPDGRPGLLYIHGGPMFQYGHDFFDEFQMAAACGYVVMAANPRGSDGYGEAWAQAPLGDLGNLDWADVKATADALAALPEVDADRLGVGGGSYGGFMTGWVLAHDDRFKAGLVERSVMSWSSFTGTSDIGTWFTPRTIGATIEDDRAEVDRQSPLTHAGSITAPTLIVHSEEDWRCPIEQGEQLFAALRRNGVDVTMVRFPGESHGLTRGGGPRHRVERFEIVHEFFARHLDGGHFDSAHLGLHDRWGNER
jgi:dipeptidyl aminopeptidase/acylaminoacyl peptidase